MYVALCHNSIINRRIPLTTTVFVGPNCDIEYEAESGDVIYNYMHSFVCTCLCMYKCMHLILSKHACTCSQLFCDSYSQDYKNNNLLVIMLSTTS